MSLFVSMNNSVFCRSYLPNASPNTTLNVIAIFTKSLVVNSLSLLLMKSVQCEAFLMNANGICHLDWKICISFVLNGVITLDTLIYMHSKHKVIKPKEREKKSYTTNENI